MGNGQSVAYNINQQNMLLQEINGVALELTEQYKNKFLNPAFCTTIALIYNDKLMTYRKQDLGGVAATLGVAVDLPEYKQKICDSIIQHYTNRINLIAAIQSSLNYCSNRIFALTTGPRCMENPEIFDEAQCVSSGGRWSGYITPPDESLHENGQWYQYLYNMQKRYIETLARLLAIMQQLKQFDNEINDEQLRVLGEEVKVLIDSMQKACYQLYKLALTTPTFTQAEIMRQREDQQIAQMDQSAREASLRAAHGLATMPQQ